MDFMEILTEYGLVVVLAGLIASILCGLIKLPIKKKIFASETLTDKEKSDRVRNICTAIVAVLSTLEIVIFRCVCAQSFSPLSTAELYTEILTAIAFSKIAYMLYEGVGVVSLKKWIQAVIDKIKNKVSGTPAEDSVKDFVSLAQSALTEILHMPLTDSQKEIFEKALRGDQETEHKDGTDGTE